MQKLNLDLSNQNWNNVININNPSGAYNKFIQTYKYYLDKHMPPKTVRFNKFKHKKENWITKGLLKSMKTKDKLYHKLKPETRDNKRNEIELKYKQYRNKLNTLIRLAKKLHYERSFRESKHDIKATWQNINKIINRSKNNKNIPDVFKYENSQYSCPKSISNGFNSFFTNIGLNLASKIPNCQTDPLSFLPPVDLPNSFALTPTTCNEIATLIDKLRPKHSHGFDNISPKLVKDMKYGILKPLVHIVNQSLSTGIVPNKMKLAKIVPIFKTGDTSLIKNYRPISLLPTFSKLLERLVYNRLYSYLMINKLISPCQYGFQKHKSTELAISELQDRIISAIAKKKVCVGIFLDLSKAFDTLNHSLLLNKLEHYGIRGLARAWFSSYLENREQFTCILDHYSDKSAVTCGVPQGSILGPLLFLIYVNDITNISANSYNMILFADDTNLIFELENQDNQFISKELTNISKWFSTNKLSFNLDKTKFILFGNKPPLNAINLKINGVNISRVNSISFLGVKIQEDLKWTEHLSNQANKVAKVNSILYRLKHILPETVKLQIYNALVVPYLTYGIVAWGDTNRSLLKRLHILQKKCLRTVANTKYNSHTDPLFKKYKLLKLQDIFKLNCCKLYHRKVLKTLPEYHSQKLPSVESLFPHFSRQSHNIYLRIISTNIEKQLLNYKIGTCWNSLPDHIKQSASASLISFSKKVKFHIIYSYNQHCAIRNCRSCIV
jgi:hypothetical protein